ncbi:PqqD family protein [Desulfosporosinus sp. HMP52]|uniref:PqqD family protein n=1 Tax=Desulfosporosinus sp. HMP52 TaxID=1487923 RepID=UPI000B2456C4|nr:PqqD family protein [Desulfosporosinus sp. HMP52]
MVLIKVDYKEKDADRLKLKNGFLCREVAGQWVVVPLGERVVEFNGIMTLSESGALLWRNMDSEVDEEDLVKLVLSEYIIDEDTAREDVREFVVSLKENGLIE